MAVFGLLIGSLGSLWFSVGSLVLGLVLMVVVAVSGVLGERDSYNPF